MKPLPWLLAGFLLLGTPGCIYVHVSGDLDEEFWDDDDDHVGFQDLSAAVQDSLVDPRFDLNLDANPWHTEAAWTVRYGGAGSDGATAFHKAKEAVLGRIQREGGTLTTQSDDGPHAWSCSFRLEDDESGSARVRLIENADAGESRPHRLEVVWEQSD